MNDATPFNAEEFSKQVQPDLHRLGIKIHDFSKPVYKYVSFETACKILEQCSVLFRTPNTFNDPFEFHPDIFDYSMNQSEFKQKILRDLEKSPKYMSLQDKMKFIQGINITNYKEAHRKVAEDERNNALLFCTSQSNNKTLMWSHYADNHKGICIGIFMPPVHDSFLTMTVNYTNEIIPKRILSLNENERGAALLYWIYTKSEDWKYEEEVRTIIVSDGHVDTKGNNGIFVNLAPTQIREIYFGISTPSHHKEEIKRLIQAKNYEIKKWGEMIIKRGTFSLDVNPLSL